MDSPTSLWPAELPQHRISDVRDTSLAKLVRDDTLAQILSGVLVPGQRINEPDVAKRLQVSRVPVREALRELESSGLVVSRKHSGVFVRQLDDVEIRDLYQMRSLLDGFAGRSVAQLPLPERKVLSLLLSAATNAMQHALSEQDVQAYYAENLRFHWAIVQAVGNQQLLETYRGIVQKLHLSRLKNLSQSVSMQVSVTEHKQIVEAVRQADAQQCEALMTKHVSDAYQRLIEGNKPEPQPKPETETIP